MLHDTGPRTLPFNCFNDNVTSGVWRKGINTHTDKIEEKAYNHNAELQRADPGTKVPGLYFPTQCPKWIFVIPIVFVEKKKTLN